MTTDTDPIPFTQVFREELATIAPRPDGEPPGDPRAFARQHELFGMAISGGGIRSATFALGVLQAMASRRLLRRLDYLSTVSGGGYIGGWLSAWLTHAGGDMQRVEETLARRNSSAEEPECHEIRFLREHSNYLTPRRGLTSGDTWAMIASYSRNLLLHLTVVILALSAVLLLPRVLDGAFDFGIERFAISTLVTVITICGAIVFVVVELTDLFGRDGPEGVQSSRLRSPLMSNLVAPLLVFGAWCTAATLCAIGRDLSANWSRYFWIGGVIYALLWLGGWTAGQIAKTWGEIATAGQKTTLMSSLRSVTDESTQRIKRGTRNLMFVALWAAPAGVLGGWLLCVVGDWFQTAHESRTIWLPLLWGGPVVVAIFTATGTLHIGLVGRGFSSEALEWWNRLGGQVWLYTLILPVVGIVAIIGPSWIDQLGTLNYSWVGTWAVTTLGGLFAARRTVTGGSAVAGAIQGALMKLAPVVFILGLFLGLSWVIREALEPINAWLEPSEANRLERILPANPNLKFTSVHALLALIALLAALVLSWRFGVNRFSMHSLYRNRLVRCYLGASRREERSEDLYTGFDPGDDLPLKSFVQNRSPGRPFHIFNTTINLVSGARLAWQKRKAASFIMTPRHVGFDAQREWTGPDAPQAGRGGGDRDGYRRTELYTAPVTAGTAMALSGAAVSPNMGYHSVPAMTFLMTVFNARLGLWFPNPSRPSWDREEPLFGLFYLIVELLGLTNARRSHVYLSDGGHFENMGLYELVRRRCRYIVVCDGEQDRLQRFTGMGNAIEKCRADFGIEIDIDLGQVKQSTETGLSEWHGAVGRIRYSAADPQDTDGIIVYLKASLTGDEPEDIATYRAMHSEFPHETTGDQWFDETQFESYRKLGLHVGTSVFEGLSIGADESLEGAFVGLRHRWYPPSSGDVSQFTRHGELHNQLIETLRTDPKLGFLTAQMYPVLTRLRMDATATDAEARATEAAEALDRQWLPASDDEIRAGFLMCHRFIDLLENVYLDLDLETNHAHPDNRGWMNAFRRWWWSRMFRLTWAVTVSCYGSRVQGFCEKHLGFDPGTIEIGDGFDVSASSIPSHAKKKAFWDGKVQDHGLNYFEARLLDTFLRNHCERIRGLAAAQRAPKGTRLTWTVSPIQIRLPESPIRDNADFHYNVGFAVTGPGAPNLTDCLVCFRIQSHLRMMGLARRALEAMLSNDRFRSLSLDLETEFDSTEEVDSQDRHRFTQLFESVQTQMGS
ncbi:MAG: patatin-like phospholipase family protein [Planctomycetota bacterium]|jgi:hypothetical protein